MNMRSTETLYRKNIYPSGAVRYEPVGEMWPSDSFGKGKWYVDVHPGGKSIRYLVNPARAEVAVAIEEARDIIMDLLAEELKSIPRQRENTATEDEAIERYISAFRDAGEETPPLIIPRDSVWNIIDKVISELQNALTRCP